MGIARPTEIDIKRRRLGILGGTFDPIHNGHLLIAEEARFRLDLAKVLFVPARISPLKLHARPTSAEQRCRMVELAIAGNAGFELSRVDLDRPGPSYTVDTLRLIQEQEGVQVDLYFVAGEDSIETLLHWRAPEEIVRLCKLVVVNRPGYDPDLERIGAALPGLRASLVRLADTPELAVSSTELRQRVNLGWPIRYQVPADVEAYIHHHRLYRGDAGGERSLRHSHEGRH